MKGDQRFSRVDCVTADRGEPQDRQWAVQGLGAGR